MQNLHCTVDYIYLYYRRICLMLFFASLNSRKEVFKINIIEK